MKRIPIAIYSSADEIEATIRQLETDALALPPDSDQHRHLMQQISKFRIYADTKRWLAGPSSSQTESPRG
jgi:hypothetical protein